MRIQQRFVAILAAAFILSGSFSMFTVRAEEEQPAGETITERDSTQASDEETADETLTWEPATEKADTESLSEIVTETEETEIEICEETNAGLDFPIPDEAPMFDAHIKYRAGDYVVVGVFKDFTPDIKSIDTLYSLDGENWQTAVGGDWNLFNLDTDDESKLYGLQNQSCLFGYYEPLKSYKAGKIDLFYIKLRITKNNGLFYETQSAKVERGSIQSIPEGITAMAHFSRDIMVSESPSCRYGKYQITICADATDSDVSALLPDTLPVEVQLIGGSDFNAICVVDCPVTWKTLSLPPLSAGESIIISDAAEEILVPGGTLLRTPLGMFQLEDSLSLNTEYSTDEVRLVLNVSSEYRKPAGVLRQEKSGLQIALHQKPTGATAIQAYVLSEGESEWTELSGLSLLKELDAHTSAENSGYALVLRNEQEPYRSYLETTAIGGTPVPFFVGLKIVGGVYDGRQLVLAWPDIYEQLPDLPEVGGAGGNEGNAGSGNKDDSTESGQRPNLPQTPGDKPEEQKPDSPQTPGDKPEEQKPDSPQTPGNKPEEQKPDSPQTPGNKLEEQKPDSPQTPGNKPEERMPDLPQAPETASAVSENQNVSPQQSVLVAESSRNEENGQRPYLQQITQEKGSPAQSSAIVQAAEREDDESTLILSDMETVTEYSTEKGSHIPILLWSAAAVVAAGSCVGVAACKAAGYSLPNQIVGKIRKVLRK